MFSSCQWKRFFCTEGDFKGESIFDAESQCIHASILHQLLVEKSRVDAYLDMFQEGSDRILKGLRGASCTAHFARLFEERYAKNLCPSQTVDEAAEMFAEVGFGAVSVGDAWAQGLCAELKLVGDPLELLTDPDEELRKFRRLKKVGLELEFLPEPGGSNELSKSLENSVQVFLKRAYTKRYPDHKFDIEVRYDWNMRRTPARASAARNLHTDTNRSNAIEKSDAHTQLRMNPPKRPGLQLKEIFKFNIWSPDRSFVEGLCCCKCTRPEKALAVLPKSHSDVANFVAKWTGWPGDSHGVAGVERLLGNGGFFDFKERTSQLNLVEQQLGDELQFYTFFDGLTTTEAKSEHRPYLLFFPGTKFWHTGVDGDQGSSLEVKFDVQVWERTGYD